MTDEELQQTLTGIREMYKEQFPKKSDDEIDQMILDSFFRAFCEGKLDRESLCALTVAMGYEPDEDVLDQIEKEMSDE